MPYNNIPDELKALIQFCVWRYEQVDGSTKPTKVPYNPVTNKHVKTNDAQTWCSFNEAVEAAKDWGKWAGIGFVFSARDPYCGIDLDDPYALNDDGTSKFSPEKAAEIAARQQQIFTTFNSYAELSPSGKGLHIIIKASVPHGRKREAVEVYSSLRFFTITGNVFHDAPIRDGNELANILWAEMAPPKGDNNGYISQLNQSYDDQYIYATASAAANGDKFVDLYNGNYQAYYNSQSEADFALINIIAYYTQYVPQITRMFRDSALGKRKKAERIDYITRMISRSFDNQPLPFDISAIMDKLDAAVAAYEQGQASAGGTVANGDAGNVVPIAGGGFDRPLPPAVSPSPVPLPSPTPNRPRSYGSPDTWPRDTWRNTPPPGLLGSIVNYVMASSPRPVYEISLVAALGLLAGIAGRQFNASASGLNHYLMLVSGTGKGKEAVAVGMSRLITDITQRVSVAKDVLGPAEMASGQALLKYMAGRRNPCFISLTGEFGIRLKQVTDERASPADRTLQKVLLDLYGKSGAGSTIQPSIYSDKANNTGPIHSPAFTLVGESTGERFYEALDESAVKSGLLPRFIIIDYDGDRAYLNKNHASVPIPVNLTQAIERLIMYVHGNADKDIVQTIGIMPDADIMMDNLDRFTTDLINNKKAGEFEHELWNRVHLKVYKLAGLLAVAHNWEAPVIDSLMVEWAASLILTDTYKLLERFDKGLMGVQDEADNTKQIERMKMVIKNYITKPFHELPKYGAKQNMHPAIIHYQFIQRSVSNNAAFKKDKRGSNVAIAVTIKSLIDIGILKEIPINQVEKNYSFSGKAYAIVDPGQFLEMPDG